MILETKAVILYKPRIACWLVEGKSVTRVSSTYANTIKSDAYTTKVEADAKAVTNTAAVGKEELIP
jgi:hypothetical protein